MFTLHNRKRILSSASDLDKRNNVAYSRAMQQNEIESQLRKAGLSVTAVRVALLNFFSSTPQPASADQLTEALRARHLTLNRTTVYRELTRLVEKGLVEEVLLASRARVYELAQAHHHHAICTNCEVIQHVKIPEQLTTAEKLLQNKHGFTVQRHSLEFYGLCQACLLLSD
jgi:Fe2+ or Zn2+ uptake regulation protein